MKKSKIFRYVIAILILAFALVTLFMSSSVLFNWFGIRAKQGDFVPFIVWTNFVAGFIYLIAALGFLQSKKWTLWILTTVALLLFIALMILLLHIDRGGSFEFETIRAMVFRIVLTITFSLLAYYQLIKYKR
ncbi:hypothetical protein [Salegentibacter salegens]|uniref:Integral membrane protein n=1 Tax=Salegentibacter salegens TaxID=143223 RepID=A0A1M7KV50_9FLAO|nr:hypothetical protein [Salegentibacter salegens]PRX43821.1 hypothetical protein LY58_02232 [Salegentibacter salegens]SHM69349.1 hypothetical protein SAMN05878281_1617 [Salegentibacter salegens]